MGRFTREPSGPSGVRRMRQALVGGRSFSAEESRPAPDVGAALQFSILVGKAPVALRPPPFRQGRLPCLVPGSRPIRDRAGSARKPRAGLPRPDAAPARATSLGNGKAPRQRRPPREAVKRRTEEEKRGTKAV